MKVTVRLLSGADHLSQILTGFQMLSQENKLTLDILDCRKDSPVYQEAFLEAQVNGIRILFDLMDGYWYNRPETVFPLYHSPPSGGFRQESGVLRQRDQRALHPLCDRAVSGL